MPERHLGESSKEITRSRFCAKAISLTRKASGAIRTCTAPAGHWGISSFQLALHARGTARFGLRISLATSTADLVLETRGIAAALIGADWERLFAQTAADAGPPPPPASLAEELAQLSELWKEGALSEAEFVEAKQLVLRGKAPLKTHDEQALRDNPAPGAAGRPFVSCE